MCTHLSIQRIDRMTGGTDGYIGTDHDLIANIHIHIIYDDQIEIGIKLIPQMNMITVRHMYRTFNKHTVRTMPENPFQNFFFLHILARTGVVIVKHHFFAVTSLRFQFLFLFDIDRICMSMFIKSHPVFDSIL